MRLRPRHRTLRQRPTLSFRDSHKEIKASRDRSDVPMRIIPRCRRNAGRFHWSCNDSFLRHAAFTERTNMNETSFEFEVDGKKIPAAITQPDSEVAWCVVLVPGSGPSDIDG